MVYGRLVRPTDSPGNYVSWDRLANQLKESGVEAVAFRIDEEKRYIDENNNGSGADEMLNYHNQIKLMTAKLKERGIKVLLFARIWLSNRKNKEVFELFDTYLGTLSHKERNLVDGIALTEIHLDKIDKLKNRTKSIPSKFEDAYPGWLQKRMFLMPGLDNGFRFTGINNRDNFHQDMSSRVGEFAFVVKSMKLKKIHDHDHIYSDFPKYIRNSSSSIVSRENYMNNEMSINELVKYQESTIPNYPKMANIVYWGDAGDAMTNIDPKTAQALHNVLNVHGGENNRSTFMYLGVGSANMIEVGKNGTEQTVAKSIIWYDQEKDSFQHNDLKYGKWKDKMSVYDQWSNWSKEHPHYHEV